MKSARTALRSCSRRGLAVVAACAALAFAPPAALAHWSYVYSYATGFNGSGGLYSTPGFGHRHLRRVWHEWGTWWCTWYYRTDQTVAAHTCDYVNPVGGWVEISYAAVFCYNWTDESGVRWTCQTTVT